MLIPTANPNLKGAQVASTGNTIWSVDSIKSSARNTKTLLFSSHGDFYAVPAGCVQEVIAAPVCVSVPRSPEWFVGLASFQSKPVPAIDVGRYFLHEEDTSDEDFARAIVLSFAGCQYLLMVHKVFSLCQLQESAFIDDEAYPGYPVRSHSALQAGYDRQQNPAIEFVCEHENKQVAVIDLPGFLRLTRFLRVSA